MQLLFIGQKGCVLICLLKIIAKLNEIGPKGSHRGILLSTVAVRNHNDSAQTHTLCGKRDALAMIATRGSNYSTQRWLAAAQRVHINQTTADFECAQRRMILVLYPDFRA